MKVNRLFKYTNIQLPKTGLLSLDGLQKTIDKEIPYLNIEDLPVPLYIGTSNLTEAQMEYKNSGPLSKTVLASSSIPILFSPVELDGYLYADGGLLENIPVWPLIDKCEKIVVSNISPLQKPAQINNLIQMITRTFLMSIHARINMARDHADLYIEPQELTEFDVLSVSKADEMFEIGYNAVKKLDDSVFAPILY
jgi:NTE family protein